MDDGNTLLNVAVRYNRVDISEILIVCGANTNIYNNQGNTPLHYAVDLGNKKL